MTGSLKSGEINPSDFFFERYSSTNKDDDVIYDLMHYNGTEAVKLASDLVD